MRYGNGSRTLGRHHPSRHATCCLICPIQKWICHCHVPQRIRGLVIHLIDSNLLDLVVVVLELKHVLYGLLRMCLHNINTIITRLNFHVQRQTGKPCPVFRSGCKINQFLPNMEYRMSWALVVISHLVTTRTKSDSAKDTSLFWRFTVSDCSPQCTNGTVDVLWTAGCFCMLMIKEGAEVHYFSIYSTGIVTQLDWNK